jgi:chitin synthase
MAYLMFASIFVTVKSVQEELKDGIHVSDLFQNTVFSALVVSLASTYILWFVISFIFFDPWHMFTCLIQYLLLTPTYINILNVYAFCNTHDITWGTKGDTKPEKLGGVTVGVDGKIKVDLPTEEADLNTQYERELNEFSTHLVIVKAPPSEEDKKEDYYKGFRSVTVLAWIFTNLALTSVVLSTGGTQVFTAQTNGTPDDDAVAKAKQIMITKIYLNVVLWSVAGLSLFRFLGSLWYLVIRMVRFS